MIETKDLLLHITEDEKFIDYVIDVFESVYPGRNVYFIAFQENASELLYVKSINPNIVKAHIGSIEYKELINKIDSFKGVIIHNLITEFKQDIILNASPDVYFHWMAWGADLYSIPILSRKVILPYTKKYQELNKSRKEIASISLYNNHPVLFNILYPLFYREESPLLKRMRCYRKVKSVSTVTPQEYRLVQKTISKSIKYLPFKYISTRQLNQGKEGIICTGNNIIVGNSATLENNHIDTFKLLDDNVLSDKLLFCPLSYGDKLYGNYVIAVGREMFKEKFVPVTDFLPFEEYSNFLLSCGNVIMNNIRQQGMGIILLSLWKGARVFINEKSPIFEYLKGEGMLIYNLSDLKNINNLPDFNTLASHNRPIIDSLYNENKVQKETLELIDYILKEN
ncbi:MAG: TDP-N-acetylfucosamine:lipid II N-acetylfucosaminyltransferase [Bacteroidales bacterium]|nr:TDP-N-acetylfucosamine:lipid II N-acetylfucosaminyltransferase [Bacteroidales bacterium]